MEPHAVSRVHRAQEKESKMKKELFLLSLIAIAPLVVIAQTPPTSTHTTPTQTAPSQTAPKTKLGATLVRRTAVAPLATASGSQYTQIDFNWAYTANAPTCGASLTNCFSGFTLTDTTLGAVIATPSTIGPTSLSYAYVPSGGVPFGTSAFSLVANGYNGSGSPATSTPVTVSVVVNVTTLNAPTNLTGAPQ